MTAPASDREVLLKRATRQLGGRTKAVAIARGRGSFEFSRELRSYLALAVIVLILGYIYAGALAIGILVIFAGPLGFRAIRSARPKRQVVVTTEGVALFDEDVREPAIATTGYETLHDAAVAGPRAMTIRIGSTKVTLHEVDHERLIEHAPAPPPVP